jgi:peroxiredoxin
MPIDVGTQAPDFTLKTQDEKEWKLSSQKGKNVVLLFYPLDWSPTCEKENCKISEQPATLGNVGPDTVVVGVSRDSTWSHKAWKQAKGIKHDLLADPTLEVASKFGLKHPAVPFISHRATVVVDKTGKVAFVQVQENTKEERNWGELQAALKKLG